jgi:hypothetical protein
MEKGDSRKAPGLCRELLDSEDISYLCGYGSGWKLLAERESSSSAACRM